MPQSSLWQLQPDLPHNHPSDHILSFLRFTALLCNCRNSLLYTSSKLTTVILIPLSLADFLPTSCSATIPSVPTWALGNPAHFSPQYFFSPTSRSLPTTHLLQCKHTVVSLLDSSSSTSTAQCSSNDRALKCRLEICYFSSDLMISTLAFTLCYHKRNIFPRIS